MELLWALAWMSSISPDSPLDLILSDSHPPGPGGSQVGKASLLGHCCCPPGRNGPEQGANDPRSPWPALSKGPGTQFGAEVVGDGFLQPGLAGAGKAELWSSPPHPPWAALQHCSCSWGEKKEAGRFLFGGGFPSISSFVSGKGNCGSRRKLGRETNCSMACEGPQPCWPWPHASGLSLGGLHQIPAWPLFAQISPCPCFFSAGRVHSRSEPCCARSCICVTRGRELTS